MGDLASCQCKCRRRVPVLAFKDGSEHPNADREMVNGLKDQVCTEPRRGFIGEELVMERVNVERLDVETESRRSSLWIEANQVDNWTNVWLVMSFSGVCTYTV